MASLWHWGRANAKVAGIGLGTLGVASAVAWNSTETWRMARNIKRGLHTPPKPEWFEERFCVFSMDEVSKGLITTGMVSLIGLKSSGKSTTLSHVVRNSPNPLFISVSCDDVYEAVYCELKRKIWALPWLADGLRADASKSKKHRVWEIFDLVKQQTGKPVLLGLDITFESMANPLDNSSTVVWTAPALQVPVSFNPVNFVKRVKFLVEDLEVAKAVITSSEGLLIMSVNEDRLWKILGCELPFVTAKSYLEAYNAEINAYDEEMLYQFQRTFAGLKGFAMARDKAEFCRVAMKKEIAKVNASKKHCDKAESLYLAAVQRGSIDVTIIEAHCGSQENFIHHFVKTNIFGPCPDSDYRLQFDCTKRAAKEIFGI